MIDNLSADKMFFSFCLLFLFSKEKVNVDKLPNMEPFSYSSKILYSELISIMKQSTQEYYNMRSVLGLKY